MDNIAILEGTDYRFNASSAQVGFKSGYIVISCVEFDLSSGELKDLP